MGLLLTQLAASSGAGAVVVLDLYPFKLSRAREAGATHVINVREVDTPAEVYRVLPDGPELVFEAAGSLEAAQLAFDLCRRGTRINMFGVTTPGKILVSPGDIHFKEIRMDASFGVTPRVMAASITLIRDGLVRPERIITHRFPLSQAREAMETMKEEARIKIMVMP